MKVLHRTSVSAGDGLDFVISDGSLDRHGTRINPKGWDLTNFRKNPIALFGHDSRFPIGTWSNIRTEGDRLVATLKLAAKGTSQRIDEIIGLVEQGVLRATSVGFSVIKYGTPGKDQFDYLEQELMETSVVSVGSNTNALAKARALNLSPETLSIVFGESANERRGTVTDPGATAATPPVIKGQPTMSKTNSQRIVDVQASLVARRDKLTQLQGAETRDLDAIETTLNEIDQDERELALLERMEKKAAKTVQAPATARQPLGFRDQKLNGVDLLVRRALVHGVALHTGRAIDQVLDERYPGRDEATELAVKTRAEAPLATTGTSGFVSQLVQSTWADFMGALTTMSVYPGLRDRGRRVSFDAAGTAYLPQRTGSGANGSFFAEGSPIRVGRVTVAAPTFTSRKMGVIIPFSREAAKRATPDLEGVLRTSILEDTAKTLDPILLDDTAGDTIRPAGLLYGVSAAASGYGGGDHVAVKEDFKTLLKPFIDAGAAGGITVIMNPAQSLAISLMDGPDNNANWFQAIRDRITIIESENATANRLIALRNPDFATGLGDMPEFEISNQATIHMEDTSPAALSASASPNTVAAPIRSFFQTDSLGIRMIMDVSWTMARSGMVQWIDTTSY